MQDSGRVVLRKRQITGGMTKHNDEIRKWLPSCKNKSNAHEGSYVDQQPICREGGSCNSTAELLLRFISVIHVGGEESWPKPIMRPWLSGLCWHDKSTLARMLEVSTRISATFVPK